MPTIFTYPFDPAGTLAANKIVAEQHVITSVNFRDYHFVIPKFAPFFSRNLTLSLRYPDNTVRTLVEGADYHLAHQFLDASKACAKPVYGSISFTDTDTYGVLTIGYQTIGGMWNITPTEITEILSNVLRNPRITAWEQITTLPERFPVVDHQWDLVDMVGERELVASVDAIRNAIVNKNSGGISDHIVNYDNPHAVTKTHVGLGSVSNLPLATTIAAITGSSHASYMTPLRTAEAIDRLGGDLIRAHEANSNNPHNVTKNHVGLGKVNDYPVATNASAISGLSSTEYMTPYHTRLALNEASSSALTHSTDYNNPHNVSKDQVGLFNLENYAIADAAEARGGLRNDRYMTPLRTTQLVAEYVTVQLDGHSGKTDNPHNVTKTQIGLEYVDNFPTASISTANARISNSHFMTPAGTAYVAQAIAQEAFVSHTGDTENPHSVTAAQLGLYTKVEVNNLLDEKLDTNGTVSDSNRFAGLTQAQYLDYLRFNWTDISAAKFSNRTYSDMLDEVAQRSDTGLAYVAQARGGHTTLGDTAINDFSWIKIGFVKQESITIGTEEVLAVNDSVWLFHGGVDYVVDPNKPDPTAIVTASVRGAGSDPCALRVDSFNNSDLSGYEFGYTWDVSAEKMFVWVKVSNNSYPVVGVDLLSSKNALAITEPASIVEPTGIVYIVAKNTIKELTDRIEALEIAVAAI